MTRHPASLTPNYFVGLYADNADPWRFATSPYEQTKYAATLASLPHDRYRRVLEVGCSIGVFTRLLADRSDHVLAIDVVASVLEQARAAFSDLPNVVFACAAVPEQWPDGQFDLIILSEVAYYLDRRDLARLVQCTRHALLPGGNVVLVHWLGETDYPLSGDEAADTFIEQARDFARVLTQERTTAYRLDVLQRLVNSAELTP